MELVIGNKYLLKSRGSEEFIVVTLVNKFEDSIYVYSHHTTIVRDNEVVPNFLLNRSKEFYQFDEIDPEHNSYSDIEHIENVYPITYKPNSDVKFISELDEELIIKTID